MKLDLESFLFFSLAILSVGSAIMMITRRSPITSALFLILNFFTVSGLYLLLKAQFIAIIQVLVYMGAIMVLFLFVIMLVNVSAEEMGREEIFNKQRQVTTSLIFCFLLVLGLLYAVNKGAEVLTRQNLAAREQLAEQQTNQDARLRKSGTGTSRITKDTEAVGAVLYRYASLPFEIASILLLVAIIGSVMLARTLKQEASVDDVDPDVLKDEAIKDPELLNLDAASQ